MLDYTITNNTVEIKTNDTAKSLPLSAFVDTEVITLKVKSSDETVITVKQSDGFIVCKFPGSEVSHEQVKAMVCHIMAIKAMNDFKGKK